VKNRKHILLIAMLDSVHTARWLEQFVGENLAFTIFPSKKFKVLHPKLQTLIARRNKGQFKFYWNTPLTTAGYSDFLRFNFLGPRTNSRQSALNKLISRNSFDYIHALEIQGAGYLLLERAPKRDCKTIITNWGSDIYYFKQFDCHLTKIKKLLANSDAYSGECIRDYALALELGFSGTLLPCIPNAGGYVLPSLHKLPTERTQIIVKGYGGLFGRAAEVIAIAPEILRKYPWVNFLFYSVTKDNSHMLKELKKLFGNRVAFRMVEDNFSYSEIQKEFQKSRIYIGCSISDGISTSFLDALVNGVYPIQTNTSCASEWIAKGAIASLINVDRTDVINEIERVIENNLLLETACVANRKVAAENLDFTKLKYLSEKFYQF
jgi:hypothetical protein